MPDAHFEVIRLEDIGKDIIQSALSTKPISPSSQKLSNADVENLKHYLNRYNHPSSNRRSIEEVIPSNMIRYSSSRSPQHYVDITDDFYSEKSFTEVHQSSDYTQPLTDIYRYHHHYRRHHPNTKHAHEKITTSILPGDYQALALELASCGLKKNTRLPVPYENFSLANGCFGDDAGFTMRSEQQNFLGISDGAGGNLMYGFDPRLFSESLMRNCSDLAHSGRYATDQPKRLLCHAFDRVQTENCFGSATACVLGIDCNTGQLHSVNVGDSGYVIVRNNRVVYRSRSQKMNGDCPRQLDVYPWTASLKRKGLNYTQISILDAICQNFQLELDDIVILSTDGLFDNVPDQVIERILSKNQSLKHVANDLVNHAVRYYVKPDDILVIMARLTTSSSDNASNHQ